MLDSLIAALANLLTWTHFLHLTVGVLIGLVVGILPGLGGLAGFSLVLPFIYGMDQVSALALLIGLVAVVNTSDVFTAILMGIAGSAGGQVTVLDGFPLAKRGEAARALCGAFSASLIGGIFGAVVLTLSIFVARPVILSVGFGEQLMLVLLGLSMVGVMTGASAAKGLAACGLGLLLGTVGNAPATGEWRLTLDINYLADGIPLVIVALGAFAIPEIIDLIRQNRAISSTLTLGVGWFAGLRDTIRNFWLILRCSGIGCLIGALPGLGGSVVDWVAYGHTVQTTKDKTNFGKGEIRGVLGPESANNAKEGGALIPTILFGIPASGGMAVFLGGMVLIGIQPGISMIEQNLHLTYTIVWSLALANVIGTALCILVSRQIALLTTIRYALLAPFMIMLIYFAAYQATRAWGDIITLFVIGALGVYMKRFGWPRSAMLIGFVLSTQLEVSTYQAIQVYGLSFFERPLVLAIGAITLLSVYLALRVSPANRPSGEFVSRQGAAIFPQILFSGFIILLIVGILIDSAPRSHLSRLFPLIVGGVTLCLAIYVIALQMFKPKDRSVDFDAELDYELRGTADAISSEHCLLWLLGLMAAIYLVGFTLGIALFFMAFLTVKAGPPFSRNLLLTASAIIFLAGMSHVLTLEYPQGLLQDAVAMPWPLR